MSGRFRVVKPEAPGRREAFAAVFVREPAPAFRAPLDLVVLLAALSCFAALSIDMYLPGLPALVRDLDAPAALGDGGPVAMAGSILCAYVIAFFALRFVAPASESAP